MKRQLLATFLSLCLLVGLLPTVALAADEGVSTEDELNNAIEAASETAEDPTVIVIADNFEISKAIHIPSGKYIQIDGGGYTISRTTESKNAASSGSLTLATHAMFFIEGDTTINQLTIDAKGDTNHHLRGVVIQNATVDLYDCNITGAYTEASAGGGLAVVSGIANVYGGEISRNTATTGAGILADKAGTANAYDVTISNNTGLATGGHTIYGYGNSKLNIYAGEISNNMGTDGTYSGVFYEIGGFYTISGDLITNGNDVDVYLASGNSQYLAYKDNKTWTVPATAIVLTSPLQDELTFFSRQSDADITRRTLLEGTQDYQLTDDDLARVKMYLAVNGADEFTDITNNEKYITLLLDNRIEVFKKVTITYHANYEGNENTVSQYTGYGAKTVLNSNSFQRDGYIFVGWNTESDGSGTAYNNEQELKETTALTQDIDLYAQWVAFDATVSLQYQGTQTVPAAPDDVTFSDWQSENSSIVSIENNQLKANKVGETTITATATYNGNTAEVSVPVEVTPRVLTYTLAGGDTGSGSISYNYSGGHQKLSDYITFQWKDDPYTKVTLVEGTDINYTYTVTDSEGQGGGTAQTYDYLPMPVGNYDNVKFNLLNENYTFGLSGGGTRDYLEIDVHVVAQGSQRAYLASAWPKSDQNFVYTGEGVLPVEGTLNAYADNSTSSDPVDIGTFTVNIEGLNDTSFHSEVSGISTGTDLSSISGLTLPTEPGTYIITASAANDSYYLYKSLVFTISKATVTVKADDKSVYVGDAMPELTYTVSGLASGDSLSGTVSLSCEATDTNTAGTYTITPSGGAVPNTEHYNSEIVYQSGTLTVSTRSSGGGGGSSSGGSSSSNVSGSGDDVSISAGGGTVTDAQMESAVKKADKGSTITIKATSSTTVTLPVGGMADAADNDNDVLLDLRYGEVTMSARAIAGMTDGVSSNDKIKVSVANQTSSKNETISDLLDKGAAVFDVTVEVDGVEIHSFDGTLTITLTVSNLSKISDPHVLHILTNGTKEYYAPDRISGNTITVTGIRNLSTFAVIPGSEVPQSNPFTDVSTSDYYYDAVLWAADNGVTGGTSATTFSPNVTVTRAQMVTFLWRAHGSPKATGANPFTDVSTSDYYYDAVLWAVANGVTNGTSATTFSPDAPVTRAQAVTFQWRAAGSPVVSGSSFGDVAADAYYVNAVTWAVANGITNGTGGNNFSPDAAVSRAQAVTFQWRELA